MVVEIKISSMLIPIIGLGILLLVYFPQFWVRLVMRRYSKEINDIPGTGGQLAEHLIHRFELQGIGVEETGAFNDHFDPQARMVRLSPNNYSGRSLTAIAVAAHEVGHAIQFHRKEKIFQLRQKYIPPAMLLRRIGIFLMVIFPAIAFLLKTPGLILLVVGLSIGLQLLGALAYLIVLPEEWDASFNKALPILEQGDYIQHEQLEPIRRVLKAAALTYFAGALADIFNIGRWLMILLRR